MQTLGSHSRPAESEILGAGTVNCVLIGLLGDSDLCYSCGTSLGRDNNASYFAIHDSMKYHSKWFLLLFLTKFTR